LAHAELTGAICVADGVDAVLQGAREQLMLGASQLKLMASGGVASSYEPLDVTQYTQAELRAAVDAAENWGTYVMVHAYTPRAVRLAWGTDTLFDPGLAAKQGKQFAKMTQWFTPAQVLTMATATNAELLSLSGPRNPYPGALGVIEEGALADLVLVDGNPLEDISLVARPETAFAVIMKQGQIVKQTNPATAG
jgi:imidazolonepropionase-like amidohydrolase